MEVGVGNNDKADNRDVCGPCSSSCFCIHRDIFCNNQVAFAQCFDKLQLCERLPEDQQKQYQQIDQQ